MLQVDPHKRISPSEALSHPFITMEHLKGDMERRYTEMACSVFKKAGVNAATGSSQGPTATSNVDQDSAAGNNEAPTGRRDPIRATDCPDEGPGKGQT